MRDKMERTERTVEPRFHLVMEEFEPFETAGSIDEVTVTVSLASHMSFFIGMPFQAHGLGVSPPVPGVSRAGEA